jgi:hypothetical protein
MIEIAKLDSSFLKSKKIQIQKNKNKNKNKKYFFLYLKKLKNYSQ